METEVNKPRQKAMTRAGTPCRVETRAIKIPVSESAAAAAKPIA